MEEMSQDISQLALALSKAQGELTPALKDSANPFFKSKYADLASIIEAGKGPLAKHELCITQIMQDNDPATLTMITILGHSSGQWMRSKMIMSKIMPPNEKKGEPARQMTAQ